MKRRRTIAIKITVVFLGITVLVIAIIFLPLTSWIVSLLRWMTWIKTLGIWAPFIYGIFYIILTNLYSPGWIFQIGSGFLFSMVVGFITMNISIPLSGLICMTLSRYFCKIRMRSAIQKRWKSFSAFDQAISQNDWKIVFLVRLSPSFPFTLTNQMFSITSTRMHVFLIGTWAGTIPGEILYVSLGASSRSLAEALSKSCTLKNILLFRCSDLLEDLVVFLGLIATVILVLLIGILTKRAIRKTIQEASEHVAEKEEEDIELLRTRQESCE